MKYRSIDVYLHYADILEKFGDIKVKSKCDDFSRNVLMYVIDNDECLKRIVNNEVYANIVNSSEEASDDFKLKIRTIMNNASDDEKIKLFAVKIGVKADDE